MQPHLKKEKKIALLLKWTMTVSALYAKHNFKDAVPLGVLELPFPWIIFGFNPSLLYPLYHTRLLSGYILRLQDNHSTSGVPLPSCENTHSSTFSFLKHFRVSLIKVYWVLRNKQTNKQILQVLSVCSWWSFISSPWGEVWISPNLYCWSWEEWNWDVSSINDYVLLLQGLPSWH